MPAPTRTCIPAACLHLPAGSLKKFMDGEAAGGGGPRVAPGEVPVVGFCFSFALEQQALNSGGQGGQYWARAVGGVGHDGC
jgi:hypothetical protein